MTYSAAVLPLDNYTSAVSDYIKKTNRTDPWPVIPEGTRRRLFADMDEAMGYQLSVWDVWAKVVASVDADYPWWFGGTKTADTQAASYRRKFNARVFGLGDLLETEQAI